MTDPGRRPGRAALALALALPLGAAGCTVLLDFDRDARAATDAADAPPADTSAPADVSCAAGHRVCPGAGGPTCAECCAESDCAGARCTAGRCVPCAAGETVCGARCVNTQEDQRHCGRCDNACPPGMNQCCAGHCQGERCN